MGAFFLFGLVVNGPFFHWWYGTLEKVLPTDTTDTTDTTDSTDTQRPTPDAHPPTPRRLATAM